MSPVHKRGPISEKSEAALRGGFLIDEHSGVFEVGGWCREQDSNLHALRHWILSPARLPIPPSRPFSK